MPDKYCPKDCRYLGKANLQKGKCFQPKFGRSRATWLDYDFEERKYIRHKECKEKI